jgi:hypothetical protein
MLTSPKDWHLADPQGRQIDQLHADFGPRFGWGWTWAVARHYGLDPAPLNAIQQWYDEVDGALPPVLNSAARSAAFHLFQAALKDALRQMLEADANPYPNSAA